MTEPAVQMTGLAKAFRTGGREVLALDGTHEPTLKALDGIVHGPAEPVLAMSWNARMIPQTVPRSPIKGAVLPIVPRKPRFRSNAMRCSLMTMWSFSSAMWFGSSMERTISAPAAPMG